MQIENDVSGRGAELDTGVLQEAVQPVGLPRAMLRLMSPVSCEHEEDAAEFTNYVKVAFFRGTSLRPVPPGKSKHQEVRYLDVRQDDELDEAQMATWIRQAAALPGWVP